MDAALSNSNIHGGTAETQLLSSSSKRDYSFQLLRQRLFTRLRFRLLVQPRKFNCLNEDVTL